MTSRRGSPRREPIAVAATASVGATIAPITKQTGHDSPSMNVWATAATVSIVARTMPTASIEIARAFVRRSRREVKNAPE